MKIIAYDQRNLKIGQKYTSLQMICWSIQHLIAVTWLINSTFQHTNSLWCANEISYQSMIKILMNIYTTYTIHNTFTKNPKITRPNTCKDESGNTRRPPRMNTFGVRRHQYSNIESDIFWSLPCVTCFTIKQCIKHISTPL